MSNSCNVSLILPACSASCKKEAISDLRRFPANKYITFTWGSDELSVPDAALLGETARPSCQPDELACLLCSTALWSAKHPLTRHWWTLPHEPSHSPVFQAKQSSRPSGVRHANDKPFKRASPQILSACPYLSCLCLLLGLETCLFLQIGPWSEVETIYSAAMTIRTIWRISKPLES